ncbi:MAG: OPT superfamily oligopeptide transporter [Monoraphidium minutum]|nr:MAG: OPT superfamily oligopeptide transporter [Monoraphidium minutum]
MGATADGPESAHTPRSEAIRKRNVAAGKDDAAGAAQQLGGGKDAARAPVAGGGGPQEDEDMERTISELPHWSAQLTIRGFVFGTALGMLFCIIGLKLSLGTAGIIPSLNIPGGLISFAALKSLTAAGAGLRTAQRAPLLHKLLFMPFGLQENTAIQTYILSMGVGGFGSYMTAMGYQAYLNMGGAPRGSPDFHPEAVFDPVPSRTIPYFLLTSLTGAFLLTQLRRLMICEWKLPFPSGTASGIMLTSFHTASGEAAAMFKVKLLSFTGLLSFGFSMAKWFFQGTDYACGFTSWPTFGFAAMKYTFNFDWQLNYVGAGMICPHVVNWSMLLGAVLSWGIMWPMMERRAGDWYPAGLDSHDFQGLFGYKVFLVIAILMGEGMYMVAKVLYSTGRDTTKRVRASRAARRLPRLASDQLPADDSLIADADFGASDASNSSDAPRGAAPAPAGGPVTGGHNVAKRAIKYSDAGAMKGAAAEASAKATAAAAAHVDAHHKPPAMADGLVVDEDEVEEDLLQFKETPAERRLRTAVFLREVIPWQLVPLGYGGLAVLSTIFLPMIYTPLKWYYVLVAYVVSPLFALPNSYGAGLTDWDMASMYGKLCLFIFAAWAGAEGNGVIVGLAICGVVLSATSAAATLMGDFRTGYITLTAPRAMFLAQLIGQLVGCVIGPFAFMLFYKTGQVNVPNGPYPTPFADIYRGMAVIGTKGFGALPKHCGEMMGAFFAAGILLCMVRDLLPRRFAKWVPSPMAMSIPFYIGAASAIDFWLGSVVMHIWEFFDKDSSAELATTVGAGLLVGDGLWAIPSSILAIAQRAPPVCMGFYPRGAAGCALPYCMGFWLGGGGRVPALA